MSDTTTRVHCPEHSTGTLRQVNHRLTCTADTTCEQSWADVQTEGEQRIVVDGDGHLTVVDLSDAQSVLHALFLADQQGEGLTYDLMADTLDDLHPGASERVGDYVLDSHMSGDEMLTWALSASDNALDVITGK